MYTSRRWLARGAVVAVALALGATACGDDSDSAKTSSSSSSSTTAAAGSFCSDYIAVTQAFSGGPFAGDPSQPPAAEDVKQYYQGVLAGLVDKVANDEQPAEIKDAVATLVDTSRKIGQTGDTSAFEDPAVGAASDKADAHVYENCDLQTADVMAVDYSYQDLPQQLDAGLTGFRLMNHSTTGEMHELIVVRKNDGTTESWDELLGLPDDQAMAKVTIIGTAFAPRDQSAYAFADLEPGSYLALCFLPQGSIGEAPGDGPPHFTLGMKQEFTVK